MSLLDHVRFPRVTYHSPLIDWAAELDQVDHGRPQRLYKARSGCQAAGLDGSQITFGVEHRYFKLRCTLPRQADVALAASRTAGFFLAPRPWRGYPHRLWAKSRKSRRPASRGSFKRSASSCRSSMMSCASWRPESWHTNRPDRRSMPPPWSTKRIGRRKGNVQGGKKRGGEKGLTSLEHSDQAIRLLNTNLEPQLSSPQQESPSTCSSKGSFEEKSGRLDSIQRPPDPHFQG